MLKTKKNITLRIILSLCMTIPITFILFLLLRWIPIFKTADGNTQQMVLGAVFLGILFVLLGEDYLQQRQSYSAAKSVGVGFLLFGVSLLMNTTVSYLLSAGIYKLICAVFHPTLFVLFPESNLISVWFAVCVLFTLLLYIVLMHKCADAFETEE